MVLRIIDTEATGESRDIQESIANIRHIVDPITDKRHMLLVTSSLRVVGIQDIVRTNPIMTSFVTIDKFCRRGSCRMCHDSSVLVEAKDSASLDGTPENTLIALTDGSRRGTDTITLRQKAPS